MRALEDAMKHRAVQGGEVLAGEVADEVGGGENGTSVDELHRFGYIVPGVRDSSAVAINRTLTGSETAPPPALAG
jgi:hypothetical protein